jgi:hypothetical protein
VDAHARRLLLLHCLPLAVDLALIPDLGVCRLCVMCVCVSSRVALCLCASPAPTMSPCAIGRAEAEAAACAGCGTLATFEHLI